MKSNSLRNHYTPNNATLCKLGCALGFGRCDCTFLVGGVGKGFALTFAVSSESESDS